jgi:hypothetical protein
MLFVFVVTDVAIGNAILDLITGSAASKLGAVLAQEEALVKQEAAISTAPPPLRAA